MLVEDEAVADMFVGVSGAVVAKTAEDGELSSMYEEESSPTLL
jgi:hypothetical protein